jgi:hypothetical protein
MVITLLQNTVMVVSGESGRQAFFSAKGLNLTEGFKILSGAVRTPARLSVLFEYAVANQQSLGAFVLT